MSLWTFPWWKIWLAEKSQFSVIGKTFKNQTFMKGWQKHMANMKNSAENAFQMPSYRYEELRLLLFSQSLSLFSFHSIRIKTTCGETNNFRRVSRFIDYFVRFCVSLSLFYQFISIRFIRFFYSFFRLSLSFPLSLSLYRFLLI